MSPDRDGAHAVPHVAVTTSVHRRCDARAPPSVRRGFPDGSHLQGR